MQKAGDSRLGATVENYRLLSVLGAGSMSMVYLAQRLDDPRVLVAIKVLHYSGSSPAEDQASFRMRFLREARAASQLRHENILPVLSSGEANGELYMVMPVIVGGTLTARLAHEPQPMPLGEIAHYLTQLASAIDYAHQQGIIHRDIKPANILLDEHGHIYLTDFGIARLFDSGENALTRESAPTLTRTGQVLGTPYYMAPEQIQARPVGPATDIYALGVVLYQMVTGQVPFHGDTPLAVALQHLQEAPHAPGLLRHELPPPLEAIILRALAKDPADRYATAAELANAFQAGLADITDPMATRPPTESWPFSTRFASGSTALSPTPTPVPSASEPPEQLIGATVDGYHLDSILETDELGAVFLAEREGSQQGSQESARIRFLTLPSDPAPKRRASFLLRFEQQAHDLAALRHPNLAPVTGYGAYEGRPYLLTPDNQGVALSVELAQHGAEDISAIADWLDQVVAGLECAHRRGFLHLSLTADRIYRQDDGRVVVTDAGVRGMLDDGATSSESSRALAQPEATTPEQIAGQPVGPYTDVYALGGLLYQMLTGHVVFTGGSQADIAQQHLHSTIPPLRRWRPSLPPALDRVVSQAMAKEPERRFQTPHELAAAYHAAVARSRQEAAFVMAPIASASAQRQSATGASDATDATSDAPHAIEPPTTATPRRTAAPTRPIAQGGADAPGVTTRSLGGFLPPNAPWRRYRTGFTALGVVLLVSIVASVLAWFNAHQNNNPGPGPVAANALASVRFYDNTTNGSFNTDALSMTVTSLPAAKSGHWYEAWLINDTSEHVLPLGKLVFHGGQNAAYTLTYGGSAGPGKPGVNLLGQGNRIRITYESQSGSLPAGPVMMEGVFPPGAFVHIGHLLVAYDDTPQHQGLLVGTMQQMTLLYQQANTLQQWIGLHYPKSTQCAAQSVIDIIEGKSGAHYQPLGPQCNVGQQWPSGDTYGLLGANGYLAGVADHAALAASAPDATEHIRMHSGHVQIAVKNMEGWLAIVDTDAQKVLAGTSDANTSGEIVSLTSIALHGHDIDADETIDPVPGEAGAELAYAHAQLLASLSFGPSR
ncbi:MAG TPA: protein kinase [Ktedonobacterales bacterium]